MVLLFGGAGAVYVGFSLINQRPLAAVPPRAAATSLPESAATGATTRSDLPVETDPLPDASPRHLPSNSTDQEQPPTESTSPPPQSPEPPPTREPTEQAKPEPQTVDPDSTPDATAPQIPAAGNQSAAAEIDRRTPPYILSHEALSNPEPGQTAHTEPAFTLQQIANSPIENVTLRGGTVIAEGRFEMDFDENDGADAEKTATRIRYQPRSRFSSGHSLASLEGVNPGDNTTTDRPFQFHSHPDFPQRFTNRAIQDDIHRLRYLQLEVQTANGAMVIPLGQPTALQMLRFSPRGITQALCRERVLPAQGEGTYVLTLAGLRGVQVTCPASASFPLHVQIAPVDQGDSTAHFHISYDAQTRRLSTHPFTVREQGDLLTRIKDLLTHQELVQELLGDLMRTRANAVAARAAVNKLLIGAQAKQTDSAKQLREAQLELAAQERKLIKVTNAPRTQALLGCGAALAELQKLGSAIGRAWQKDANAHRNQELQATHYFALMRLSATLVTQKERDRQLLASVTNPAMHDFLAAIERLSQHVTNNRLTRLLRFLTEDPTQTHLTDYRCQLRYRIEEIGTPLDILLAEYRPAAKTNTPTTTQ